MTVSESDWDDHKGEREAAASGDLTAWTSLFTLLWIWTVQIAGSADGAMAGWLKLVRYPRLWLKPLRYFAEIFKNAGRDEARREYRHRRRVAALRSSGWVGIQEASDVELSATIGQALRKLSPGDRRLTELYVEGSSITEISEGCGISCSTVRRRLRIALAALGNERGLTAPAA